MTTPVDTVIERLKSKLADRDGNYGDPRPMFDAIAAMWSTFLYVRFGIKLELNEYDAAMMMQLFKTVRMTKRFTEDNGDDDLGYGLLYMVMKEQDKIDESATTP